jgi:glycosyltransferase involved in cell wall biosynthesis
MSRSAGSVVVGAAPLVSICLPVRNGAERLPEVVASALAQTHENLELVISDNASTDGTEEICRELAASDRRVVYHRQAENVGLLNNFVSAMRMSRGPFFRWVGYDDRLHPESVARSLEALLDDDRTVLATTRVAYIDAAGVTRVNEGYDGVGLASDDPIVRLTEMLRLLNETMLLIDPLYGLFRRSAVSGIPRRNMVKEDEVFATKVALAGPWVHVPEVLLHRRTNDDSLYDIVRKLDVPAWEAYVAGALQCREMLQWLPHASLTPKQRRRARAAIAQMYFRRQRRTYAHRARKVARMVTSRSHRAA